MERNPLSRLSFEDGKNGKKDEKNKRRKRGKFTAPIPLESTENDGQPQTSALDKAVAELALKKRAENEAAAKEKAAGEAETPRKSKASTESSTATKESAEKPVASETDGRTVLRDGEETTTERAAETERYKLLPTDLNGGEVIIHLKGDASREERVLPLTGENTADESPASPSAESEPAVEPFGPDDAEVANSAGAADSGGGETPPPEPPETLPPAADEPEPPRPPHHTAATASFQGSESPNAPRLDVLSTALFGVPASHTSSETTFGEGRATAYESGAPKNVTVQKELDDTVYRATKAGQNHGVVAGLLVGSGFEHWRHHRREKKQAKVLQQQNETLQEIQNEQTWQRREHAQRFEALQRTVAGMSPGSEAPRPAPAVGERPVWPNRTIEQPFSRTEPQNKAEQAVGARRPAASGEAKQPVPVTAPQERPLEMPPEHRLQTSAWHSIEVDTRTGKPVERPTFEYGHEYYRERAQETGPKEPVNAAAGEAALVAAALASSANALSGRDSANQPMLPPSAETQVTPQVVAKQKIRRASSKLQTNGPVWPWAVALVVVVFLLIVALR